MKLAALVTGAALTTLLAAPVAQAGARVGVAIVVGHDDYRYGNDFRYGGGRNTWRVGYDRGYQDGAHHGERDGERHEEFNYWHDKRYRRADNGYRPHCGPIYVFQAGYRQGYERGYREAYSANLRQCRRNHDHKRYDYGYRDDRYRDDGYRDDGRWQDRDRDDDGDWRR